MLRAKTADLSRRKVQSVTLGPLGGALFGVRDCHQVLGKEERPACWPFPACHTIQLFRCQVAGCVWELEVDTWHEVPGGSFLQLQAPGDNLGDGARS